MENETVLNYGAPDRFQIEGAPEHHLHISAVITQCNFLHGRVLTIIDASYSNQGQNKAIKDLVRRAFREQMDYLVELSNPKSQVRSSMQSPVATAEQLG